MDNRLASVHPPLVTVCTHNMFIIIYFLAVSLFLAVSIKVFSEKL
jgi:hypothetical protein